jgi:hypothetical protein
MDKEFPIFESHEVVMCFNCGTHLEYPHELSGYPDGKYWKHCPACEMRTFYDVKEN